MKSAKAIVILTLVALSACSLPFDKLMELVGTQPTKEQFKLWHYAMQRSYDLNSEVALQKYKIFKSNLKLIKEHNNRQSDYKLGLGPFTDISWEEFKQTYLYDMSELQNTTFDFGWMEQKEIKEINFDSLNDDDNEDQTPLADYTQSTLVSRDWRALHPAPKDQGECMSCWAFATIATFEAQLLIQGKNVLLSEQELNDCSRNEYNGGCMKGGFLAIAMDYIYRNGVAKGSDYKYTAVDGACRNKSTPRAIRSFRRLNNCSDFQGLAPERCTPQRILQFMQTGPVATGIEVTDGLQHYRQGKWYPTYCKQANHAVEIVYLAIDPKKMTGSVTIRNSWGNWGKNGMGEIGITPSQGMPGCGALLHALNPLELY